MKQTILITLTVLFLNCGWVNTNSDKKGGEPVNFKEISSEVDCQLFERVKNFVLTRGDRKFFRNFDGNNPHYRFQNCHVYLGADIGQRNMGNDPALSDFNQIVINGNEAASLSCELVIVRKGDLKEGKAWVQPGMEEEKVYLTDAYNKGLDVLEKELPRYLEQMRKEIKASNKIQE